MMNPTLRTVIAIVLISLGGAILGRALGRWAQRKLTRTQLLAGIVSGAASIGIGVTFRMNRTGNSYTEWIELACILAFTAGILIDARERGRLRY